MRGKWLWMLGAAVVLAIVGVSVSRTPVKPASAQAQTPAPHPPSEVTLSGTIQAKTVIKIGASVEGILDRVLVDKGEAVYEGELLAVIKNARLNAAEQIARLEAEKAQARVSELENALIAARLEASRARADATRSQNDLERAEKNYKRQEMLNREGATPRLTFEAAENEYNRLKSETESLEQFATKAEDRVNDLTKDLEVAKTGAAQKSEASDQVKADMGSGEVHSTADGILLNRRANGGDPVDTSMDNLFEIATNLTALQVLLAPDAKTLALIKTGQPAAVLIAALPAGIPGNVGAVQGGQVLVDFTNPSPAGSPNIRPGLSAQVKIKIG